VGSAVEDGRGGSDGVRWPPPPGGRGGSSVEQLPVEVEDHLAVVDRLVLDAARSEGVEEQLLLDAHPRKQNADPHSASGQRAGPLPLTPSPRRGGGTESPRSLERRGSRGSPFPSREGGRGGRSPYSPQSSSSSGASASSNGASSTTSSSTPQSGHWTISPFTVSSPSSTSAPHSGQATCTMFFISILLSFQIAGGEPSPIPSP